MNSPSNDSGCPLHRTSQKIHEILDRTFQKPLPDGSIPRTFHRKTHAALQGTFKVTAPEDPLGRHGLFEMSADYPAVVRFSSSFYEDDSKPDGRGMAIKLGNVSHELCEGATPGVHDFLLVSDEQGLAPDAKHSLMVFEQLDEVEKLTNLKLLIPRYSIPGMNPFRIRWDFVKGVFSTIRNHARHKNLASMSFYSQTPYQLGSVAAKYQCHPTEETRQRAAKTRGKNFSERLQRLLEDGPISFDFFVQPRIYDEDPLDDACVIWISPKLRVARLDIPEQDVAATLALGEHIAFSPWNCAKAHTPLGSINEVRRQAYVRSIEKRNADPSFP